MAGGRYGVATLSFSCCRLEADVGGITPPVSSLTLQTPTLWRVIVRAQTHWCVFRTVLQPQSEGCQ